MTMFRLVEDRDVFERTFGLVMLCRGEETGAHLQNMDPQTWWAAVFVFRKRST